MAVIRGTDSEGCTFCEIIGGAAELPVLTTPDPGTHDSILRVCGNPLADSPPGSNMLIFSPEIVGLYGDSGNRLLTPSP